MPDDVAVAAVEVDVVSDAKQAKKGDYTIKNPKSTGMCTTCFSGGMTLNEWDIEDMAFYENEGKGIASRNLWASIPNLLLGFAVWIMWSVIANEIQNAHTRDPGVYYFADFATPVSNYDGANRGFRGCPGWYEKTCCLTFRAAPNEDFQAWLTMAKATGGPLASVTANFATADDFMDNKAFKLLKVSTDETVQMGFKNYDGSLDSVSGCKVDKGRIKAYKKMMYIPTGTAGLSGGIFRLPNSFVTPIVGGRNVKTYTSILLAVPCLMLALTIGNGDVPLMMVTIAALFSGVGGGAFASSMANISPIFPKRQQGYALGMNGGLGNLGVSLVQLVLPNVLFPFGDAKDEVGGAWIANGGWFLFPLCLAGALAAFLFMNNMPKNVHDVPDNIVSLLGRYISLQGPAYGAAFVGFAVLFATQTNPAFQGAGAGIARVFILVLIACIVEHIFIYMFVPGVARPKLKMQLAIFKEKEHRPNCLWMTYLYIMTFGSFIGFSGAFPKLITDIFDEYGDAECAEVKARILSEGGVKNDCLNPDAPKAKLYSWLGALIGSLIRPVGGIWGDKYGGGRVTHYSTVLLTIVTFGLGWICIEARRAQRNKTALFAPFLICNLLLFFCTGLGNGSTFRQIGVLFDKSLAPAVLGWSSAIASFGAFVIPSFFGVFIGNGTPEVAYFILGGYYFSCIFVNWWRYTRKNAPYPC